ncbi:MAG: TPM domain-containing protein [Elainellaceae cyanobacterium]
MSLHRIYKESLMLQSLLGQGSAFRRLTAPWFDSRTSNRWRRSRRSPLKQVLLAGFGLLLALFSVLLQSIPVEAVPISEVPDPRATGGWVTDRVGILNDSAQTEINTRITELEATDGSEIVVVVVRDTQPAATPRDYALELFNTWGIGKAEQDNGVLLLVSTGDRRVEILTGDGLGQRLPDAQVQSIVDRVIIPRFKQEDYGGGVLQGTVAVIDALKGVAPPSAANSGSTPSRLMQGEASLSPPEVRGWPGLVALIENLGLYVAAAFAIATGVYLGAVKLFRRRIFVTVDGRSRTPSYSTWSIHGLLAIGAWAVTFNFGLFIFAAIALFSNPSFIFPAFLVITIGLHCINPNLNLRAHAKKYDTSVFSAGAGIFFRSVLMLLVLGVARMLWIAAAHGAGLIDSPLDMSPAEQAVDWAFALALYNFVNLQMWLEYRFFLDANNKLTLTNFLCDRCRHPLTPIDDASLQTLLTKPEETAQSLGSIGFRGWQCLSCSPILSRDGTYLLRQVLNRAKYDLCGTCEERTVTRETEVLAEATYSSSGSKKVTRTCHCCGHEEERIARIPMKVRSSSSSSSSYSSSSSSGGSSGGGSSSGGGGGGSW